MAKQYRIHIRGKQREEIDADLMARLVIMLGTQLAEDAAEAAQVAHEAAGQEWSGDGTNERHEEPQPDPETSA